MYPIERDAVLYGCTCGQKRPLTHLYFCRHCTALRCPYCVSHEVDSLYCATCLENVPSSEARLKKNRCGSCFDCPGCFHTLSTRATVTTASDAPKDAQPKKMYYLSCFNCRWTSRDAGIPDRAQAVGGWAERVGADAQRVARLLEHYRAQASVERQTRLERERKKFTVTGKYATLTDRIGLGGAAARARASGTVTLGRTTVDDVGSPPAAAVADPDDLPAGIFAAEVDPRKVTDVEQRLARPEFQPAGTDALFPAPKRLSVKRSQRCRRCDHNVTKPEFNPGSVKFKIQLFAHYHVPELRIVSCGRLTPGVPARLVVKVSNPTGHDTVVEFVGPGGARPPSPDGSPTDAEFAAVRLVPTCELSAPAAPLRLPQRDDASEYVDDAQNCDDDPESVLWRKSNKLAVEMGAVPDARLAPGDEVLARCPFSFAYTNTVGGLAGAARPPTVRPVPVDAYLLLGRISE